MPKTRWQVEDQIGSEGDAHDHLARMNMPAWVSTASHILVLSHRLPLPSYC